MYRRSTASLALAVGLALAGGLSAASSAPPTAAKLKAALEAVKRDPADAKAVKRLKMILPQVTLTEGGAPRTYYVLEGDLLVAEEFLPEMVAGARKDEANAKTRGLELVVMTVNNKDDFWPKGQRALSYAVDRASFRSQADYDFASGAFASAAKSWVDACPTCGVTFTHMKGLDTGRDFSSATFVVRFNPNVTAFIAKAFFPHYERYRYEVTLAPNWYTTTVDKTGVLRHEIGHILGYRHEQVVGVMGCLQEGGGWRPITNYDAKSVMHYLCGGGGDPKLELTAQDKAGHSLLYR